MRIILLIILYITSFNVFANPGLMISTEFDCSEPKKLEGVYFRGAVCIFYSPFVWDILTLSWNKNVDSVDGYYVYKGTTPNTVFNIRTILEEDKNYKKDENNKLIEPIIVTTEFTYKQLEFNLSNTVCFRLKAFNIIATSGYSDSVCTKLISEVLYYLDDSTLKGSPIYIAKEPPWEFQGKLTVGEHTLTAIENYNNVIGQRKAEANFFVIPNTIKAPSNLRLVMRE